MKLQTKEYDYSNLKKQGTGSHGLLDDHKRVVYPFDKYQITVELTPNDEFIGIIEVEVNKEFLSHKQKMVPQGFHDVGEFYRE